MIRSKPPPWVWLLSGAILAVGAVVIAANLLTDSPRGTSEAATEAAAGSTGTWLSAESLNGTGEPYTGTPVVAMNAAGDAIAAWVYYDGSYDYVRVSRRPAGGDWSSPETISPSGERAGESAVGIDGAGNSVVVWRTSPPSGGSSSIKAATRPAEGSWSSPETISGSQPNPASPTVAVSPDGRVLAGWYGGSGPSQVWTVYVAERPPSGSFAPPQEVGSYDHQAVGRLRAALGPGGEATLAWAATYPYGATGHSWWIQAASRPAGGSFTTQQLDAGVCEADGYPSPETSLGANEAGDAVMAWMHFSDCSSTSIQAATRSPGGSFGSPATLSSGTNDRTPTAAMDGQGDALVAWTEIGTTRTIKSAFQPAGGGFGSPDTVSTDAYSPELAMDTAGNAIVAFANWPTPLNTVYGAIRPAGGSFGARQTLSASGRTARTSSPGAIKLTGEGNGIVAWRETTDTANQYTIQAAGYDAAGPHMHELKIPAQGEIDEPLQFSVMPFDVWSDIASTDWSFGDGATAGGATATHAYGQGGTYAATVTSADAAGNSTEAGGQVLVPAKASSPQADNTGPALELLDKTLKLTRGMVRVKVKCPPNEPAGCIGGTIRIKSASKVDVGGRKKTINVGSAPFELAPGQSSKVKVRASNAARDYLQDHRSLRVKLQARASDQAQNFGTTAKTLKLKLKSG